MIRRRGAGCAPGRCRSGGLQPGSGKPSQIRTATRQWPAPTRHGPERWDRHPANMVGSGVSGALQALFKKQNIGEGALSSSLASGLGDFLSTMTNKTGSNYDSLRANSN